MALSAELLKVLVCPENKQSLSLAPTEVVECFNAKMRAGEIYTRSEKKLEQAVSDLLVREDGKVLYQVLDHIPILLIDEAVDAGLIENRDSK